MIRLHSVATRTLRSRNFKSSPAFWSRSFCSSEAPGKSVTAAPPIHLDFQFLRENLDTVQRHISERRFTENCDPQRVAELYDRWRASAQAATSLQAERNSVAKQMKSASPEERPSLVEKGRALKDQLANLTKESDELEKQLLEEAVRIPNFSHEDAPIGPEENARLIKEIGRPSSPEETPPRHHLDWLTEHGMVDMEAGSKASGPRFYYFAREAALLELALINWAMQYAVQKGFSPTITPDLVHGFVVSGCGFNPRGRDSQVYKIQNEDLYLSGTAEVPLAGRFADVLLDPEQLPMKTVAFGRAYRREVGRGSSSTGGVYRVHQFSKIELFSLCTAEQSPQLFEEIIALQQEMFTELGLHFRVLEMPTEELGAPAYRKVDIEAWMPGMNQWGEISSASTCTDYQSRRLNIRHSPPKDGAPVASWFSKYQSPGQQHRKNQYVHTLNGTACAIPRTMIALIEQGLQPDGRVRLPETLRPFMMGQTMLPFTGDLQLP